MATIYTECMASIATAAFAYLRHFKGNMGPAQWRVWDGAWYCAEKAGRLDIAYFRF